MNISICLLVLMTAQPQTVVSGPQFRAPASLPKVQVPISSAVAPRLDPPKGYKPIQVSDYVAETYMKFATTETAHDFQIFDIEKRVGVLETNREKYDRADIDSLKDTRTKALVYVVIGSTLLTIVWGALATLFGFFLKAYIAPRLKTLWAVLGKNAVDENSRWATYPTSAGIPLHGTADQSPEEQSEDRSK